VQDKTTSQFEFLDGTHGFVDNGDYYDPQGNYVNLITGDYQLVNGTTGNIYKDSGQSPPTTISSATNLPSATATGIDKAITSALVGSGRSSTAKVTSASSTATASAKTGGAIRAVSSDLLLACMESAFVAAFIMALLPW